MYKDDPQRIVIFTEDEVEPDRRGLWRSGLSLWSCARS
jgi:hypothetical protein